MSLLCLKYPFLILFNLVAFLTAHICIGVAIVHHVHVASNFSSFLLLILGVFLSSWDGLDLVHELSGCDLIWGAATVTALYHKSLHRVKGKADLL